MGRRYSQILRGGLLKVAEDNYVKHLQGIENNNSKRAKGGEVSRTTSARKAGGLRPFGIRETSGLLGISIHYPVDSLSVNEKLSADQRLVLTITEADAPKYQSPPSRFKPARVSVFTADGSRAYHQSNTTKLFYVKYGGKAHTSPFGAKTATEDFSTAKAEVIALLSTGLPKYSRVSVSPEQE